MRPAPHNEPAALDLGRVRAAVDVPSESVRPGPTALLDRLEPGAAPARTRHAFCAQLKAQRLRVGLTLEDLSGTTKINPTLFAQLEQGDLSHWPRGIYRRAFIREYATAVGLPVDDTTASFLSHFPDPSEAAPADPAVSLAWSPLRLTMAHGRTGRIVIERALVGAAVADALAALAIAGLLSWGLGTDFWPTLAVVAVMSALVTTACLGRGLAAWCLLRRTIRLRDRRSRSALRAVAPPAVND